jgi:transcriptional regulator with XRE-family HTH domain
MGRQGRIGDRFREHLRDERVRRGWSQAELAKMLSDKGIDGVYPTTIAKIEAGDRAARLDEVTTIADMFEVSVDALLGRKTGIENDLVYTLRGVLDTAQQCSTQVTAIQNTLSERFLDLQTLSFEGRDELEAEAATAQRALKAASEALGRIAMFRMAAMAGINLRFDRESGAMFNTLMKEMLRPAEEDDEAES